MPHSSIAVASHYHIQLISIRITDVINRITLISKGNPSISASIIQAFLISWVVPPIFVVKLEIALHSSPSGSLSRQYNSNPTPIK